MAKPRPSTPSTPSTPIATPDPVAVDPTPDPTPVVADTPDPTPDPVPDDDDSADAAAPAGFPLGLIPAGYILGWFEHELDSVPDQNGVSSKVRVHTLGLVPVPIPNPTP